MLALLASTVSPRAKTLTEGAPEARDPRREGALPQVRVASGCENPAEAQTRTRPHASSLPVLTLQNTVSKGLPTPAAGHVRAWAAAPTGGCGFLPRTL